MNLKNVVLVITLFILHTGFVFGGFSWMLSAKMDPLAHRIDRIEKQMDHIELEIKEIKSLILSSQKTASK